MKILVLGSSGFIGSHVLHGLIKEGYDIRAFDRTPNDESKNIEVVTADFDDVMSLSEALVDIDLVVHLISTSVPSTSNKDPISDINGNLINTVNLLELMRKSNVNKIIYFSSGGTVYGRPQTSLIEETHQTEPVCSYGVVKLAIEKYLNMYADLYGIESCILRPSNPYGTGQKRTGVQGFIGTCVSHALNGTRLSIWGDGSVVRDYVHVSDVVTATISAIRAMSFSTYNISSGDGFSLNEIINVVEKYTNKKIIIDYKDKRDFDIQRVVLDNQKAMTELNWEPRMDIESGIQDVVNHYISDRS